MHRELKTNGGMLPQSRPLEARVADNLQGCGRNGSGHIAAVQQSRGESSTEARVEPSPAFAESGVSRVFVIDKRGEPLMQCHPARARKFLAQGRARVHQMFPFTIRLVDRIREESDVQPVNVKLDPGAKTTGMAVVRQDGGHIQILHLSELTHRGAAIRKKLDQRSNYRRRRRTANLWYRKPRFDNRTRPKGWLPPSLRSRVDNTLSWVKKYQKFCPVTGIVLERVRFDTQKLQNPDISGIAYQQGTLFGYEVKEYLLEKYKRTCAYCNGLSKDPVLEIEHFVPRNPSKGDKGSNRISNLAIACKTCNQDSKKNLQPAGWISLLSRSRKKIDQVRLKNATRFLEGKRPSLSSTAAVNATRNAIFFKLRSLGLPVECSTGGRTKHNRSRLDIPKTHCLDAACSGQVDAVSGWKQNVFLIKAMGRGSYQRTRVDKYGFPRGTLMAQKTVKGFATGDMVKAVVPSGKKQGTYFGRVAVRKSGSFNIQTNTETVQGISWKYCKIISRQNGYNFASQVSSPT